MKIVDLYGWVLPKPADFFNHYKNNDVLYDQARSLWSKLDQTAVWFLIIFIVCTVFFVWVYYGPYNKRPHRHYKVKHWLLWLLITAAATFAASLLIGMVMVQSPLAARVGLILRVSFANALYGAGLYFVIACLVCNMPFLKTNAYRFLKIG